MPDSTERKIAKFTATDRNNRKAGYGPITEADTRIELNQTQRNAGITEQEVYDNLDEGAKKYYDGAKDINGPFLDPTKSEMPRRYFEAKNNPVYDGKYDGSHYRGLSKQTSDKIDADMKSHNESIRAKKAAEEAERKRKEERKARLHKFLGINKDN